MTKSFLVLGLVAVGLTIGAEKPANALNCTGWSIPNVVTAIQNVPNRTTWNFKNMAQYTINVNGTNRTISCNSASAASDCKDGIDQMLNNPNTTTKGLNLNPCRFFAMWSTQDPGSNQTISHSAKWDIN